jgi:autotransporter-associated beta strand protein
MRRYNATVNRSNSKKFRAASRRAAILLAAMPVGFCALARADDLWTNPAGGTWQDVTNWSTGALPNGMPQSGHDAVFNLGSTVGYTVNLSALTNLGGSDLNVQTDNLTINLNGNQLWSGFYSYGSLNVAAAAGQTANLACNGPGAANNNAYSGIALGDAVHVGTNGGTGHLTINNCMLLPGDGPQAYDAGYVTLGSGSINFINGGQIAKNNGPEEYLSDGDGTNAASVSFDQSSAALGSGLSVAANASLSVTNLSSIMMGNLAIPANLIHIGGGGSGPTTVTFDNSTLAAYLLSYGGNVSIGGSNTTTFTVKNGAQFSLTNGAPPGYYQSSIPIGASGGTVNMDVTGTNSIFSLSAPVTVGSNSTATVQIDNNAVATFGYTLTIASGGNLKILSGARLNVGSLDLSSAGSFDMTGGTVNLTGGTLTASTFTVPATGTFKGTGNTTGNVINNGTVAPGDAPGIITVGGNYAQGSGGTLTIGLGGTNPGTQYDQLKVTGTASFAGALNVATLNGFAPRQGNQFQILSFGPETGTFSTISEPMPLAGNAWDNSALYSSGMIKVVAAPVSAWAASGNGSWNQPGNWGANGIPSSPGAVAKLGNVGGDPIVTLDGNQTLGELNFSSTDSYTVAPGAPSSSVLIFDQGPNSAAVNVLNGSHNINVPVQLKSSLAIAISNATSSLTINGSISGAGGLTESGSGTLVLANSNSYSGPTTITGGTMILAAAGALPTGSTVANNANLNVNASNAIAQITGTGAFNIGAAGALTLSGGAASSQNALSIAAGGKLVMNNAHNSLTLNYGSGAGPNATIRKYLQNAYNSGHWDAGGTIISGGLGAITSTTAAGSNAFSISYADGSDGAVAGLSGGQEEIKFTYAGDANLDGQVNISDLSVLASHFGSTGAGWDAGDFSYDGTVNLTDLSILANHFGEGVGNPLQDAQAHSQFAQDLALVESSNPAFAAEVSQLVPEPSSLGLIALGGLGLLKRRRRTARNIDFC